VQPNPRMQPTNAGGAGAPSGSGLSPKSERERGTVGKLAVACGGAMVPWYHIGGGYALSLRVRPAVDSQATAPDGAVFVGWCATERISVAVIVRSPYQAVAPYRAGQLRS
jgi:hypothetical protein